MLLCSSVQQCVRMCVFILEAVAAGVYQTAQRHLYLPVGLFRLFDVLPINQSRLSSERPDSHKITCKSIYTCQQFDLQLKLYTKYIMKLSEL